MSNDDRDLREYFAAVRREEETEVPAMSRVVVRGRENGRRGLAGRLGVGAACLGVLIAGVVWLLHGVRVGQEGWRRGREQAAASITAWRPATDFLLETPGRELLEDVPEIGEWDGWVKAPGVGESRRALKKRILQ